MILTIYFQGYSVCYSNSTYFLAAIRTTFIIRKTAVSISLAEIVLIGTVTWWRKIGAHPSVWYTPRVYTL